MISLTIGCGLAAWIFGDCKGSRSAKPVYERTWFSNPYHTGSLQHTDGNFPGYRKYGLFPERILGEHQADCRKQPAGWNKDPGILPIIGKQGRDSIKLLNDGETVPTVIQKILLLKKKNCRNFLKEQEITADWETFYTRKRNDSSPWSQSIRICRRAGIGAAWKYNRSVWSGSGGNRYVRSASRDTGKSVPHYRLRSVYQPWYQERYEQSTDRGAARCSDRILALLPLQPGTRCRRQERIHTGSKAPSGDYQEFLNGEVRYNSLKRANPAKAERLFGKNEQEAKDRYTYLNKLVKLYGAEEE